MKNLQTFDEYLNENLIPANTLGNRLSGSKKGSTVTIDDVTYTCLGSGKWESSEGDKLTYVQVGAKATAKGTEKIEYKK